MKKISIHFYAQNLEISGTTYGFVGTLISKIEKQRDFQIFQKSTPIFF